MSISLSRVGNIELSGAEILAFDPDSQRAFVTTGDGIEILDFSDPSDIQNVGFADIGEATSVAMKNGLIAAAVVDIEGGEILDILPLGTIDHSKGLPEVELFSFGELPLLGTTPAGQVIALGGLSGLDFGGATADGKYIFHTVPDRGPNADPVDTDHDGMNERPFGLPDYQARLETFNLDPDTGEIDGGAGNDRLEGSFGRDTLEGGAGDNEMSGGLGRDLFIIGLGDGASVILDFNDRQDTIDLSAFDFYSVETATDTAIQQGSDLILVLDEAGGNLLQFIDTDVNELSQQNVVI